MAMWLEVGGAAWSCTDAACKRVRDLGARSVHCVTPDMAARQWELANITKYGMTPVLDIEIPLWVNTGMSPGADISWAKPALQAQANAGWKFFSSEGMGRGQVDVIRSVKPFLNYGSENGADMYKGQYNHATDSHYANILETYHKWALADYKNTAINSWNNVKRQGLTLMMYAADLETDTAALINYMKWLQGQGIVISAFHLWCGIAHSIERIFEPPWINIVNDVKAAFGPWATTAAWTGNTPTPPPPPPPPPPNQGKPISRLYLQLVHGQPWFTLNGQAWADDWSAPWGRMTGLWRYDATSKTWKGVAWQPVSKAGTFNYVLTNLLPKGIHVLRIQTNDGVLKELTPIEIY